MKRRYVWEDLKMMNVYKNILYEYCIEFEEYIEKIVWKVRFTQSTIWTLRNLKNNVENSDRRNVELEKFEI